MVSPSRPWRWIVSGALVVAGCVLLYGGLTKLGDTGYFAAIIAAHDIVGEKAAGIIARVLPWAEILIGIGCVAGRRPFVCLACGLYLAFLAVAARAVVLGIDVPCGCFGRENAPIGWETVLRDIAMLAAAGSGLVRGSTQAGGLDRQ